MTAIDAKITNFFYDRANVIAKIGKARAKILGRAAGLVRLEARKSIRTRKYPKRPRLSRANGPAGEAIRATQREAYARLRKASYSKPGDPPFLRRTQYPNIRTILYAHNPATDGTVVGPIEKRNRTSDKPVPGINERGGTSKIKVRVKKRDGSQRTRIVTATYPPRPVIGPAFARAAPKFPAVMANTIGP